MFELITSIITIITSTIFIVNHFKSRKRNKNLNDQQIQSDASTNQSQIQNINLDTSSFTEVIIKPRKSILFSAILFSIFGFSFLPVIFFSTDTNTSIFLTIVSVFFILITLHNLNVAVSNIKLTSEYIEINKLFGSKVFEYSDITMTFEEKLVQARPKPVLIIKSDRISKPIVLDTYCYPTLITEIQKLQ